MTTQKIILFGTRHYSVAGIPQPIRAALELVITKRRPNIGLEEWSETRKDESAFSEVCRASQLRWVSIGTPPELQFETYSLDYALDFPSANVGRYGPIDRQTNREAAMCENIRREMASYRVALVVIGLAHLHSVFSILCKDFEVEGYECGLELY